MIRDEDFGKEAMKNRSSKSLHPKIEALTYQENPMVGYKDFVLSSYKRIGDKIIATYTLLELQRAWHYTVVLSPEKEPTWWESIKDLIYYKLPFGEKFISLPIAVDRWLVTDFYTNSDFDGEEYQKLMVNFNESFNDELFDELFMKSFEEEIQRENKFLETFEKSEIMKQYNDTKGLFDSFIREVYQP